METLTESHLIDAGGLHSKSTFDTKFIDLVISERTQLRFYNTGDCFNVYIMDSKQNFNERVIFCCPKIYTQAIIYDKMLQKIKINLIDKQ